MLVVATLGQNKHMKSQVHQAVYSTVEKIMKNNDNFQQNNEK